MATMFVRHQVKDVNAWKAAYDAFDAERKTMGVTSHGAYRGDEDPNEVTVYHRFGSMEDAKAFAGSSRLQEAMKAAGVVGDPDIWFTHEL